MPRFQHNFPDTIEGKQFEPLPEGVYTVKLWDITQKMSKAQPATESTPAKPSSPYLEFVFKHEESGRNLWDRFSLKETAIWRLQQFFAVLGLEHTGPVDMDYEEILGRQVDAVVVHKEYKGKIGEQITDYRESQFGGELSDVGQVPF